MAPRTEGDVGPVEPDDAGLSRPNDARLGHLDDAGRARMVDIADKSETRRTAVAEAFVEMEADTLEAVVSERSPKGDVLAAARIAGIQAAKRTPDLIPLAHPLRLTHASVDIRPESRDRTGLLVRATCETVGRTGVEMEAMSAASVAALTVYDMLKGVERGIVVRHVRLLHKSGGRDGSWDADRQAEGEGS
jgi:cyclic pyranopterin phosphate synthase